MTTTKHRTAPFCCPKSDKGARVATYPVQTNNGVDHKCTNELPSPVWFDRKRFDEARTILDEYFLSIFLCHLSGLLLLVFVKSIYTTLSLTGKSKNLVCVFFRYMNTIMHVKLWYEGKVYDHKDDAFHSLMQVRQMHQSTCNTQNRNKQEHRDQLALSQKDMMLTQFAFIGLIVLHPSEMGFSSNPADLERLLYFWRCIGHWLGIRDEYNLCAGDHRVVRDRCQQVFDASFRAPLTEFGTEAYVMSEHIVTTANHYIVCVRHRAFIRYLFEITQVPLPTSFALDWTEHLCYIALKWCMNTLAHYRLCTFVLNNLLRLAFYRLKFKSTVNSIVKALEKLCV